FKCSPGVRWAGSHPRCPVSHQPAAHPRTTRSSPMERFAISFTLSLLIPPAVLSAQDIVSGPDKNRAVPALPVFNATGPHKEKTVDYAAERKDKTTVYLLLRADTFDRPMNRFMKALDQA